MLVANEVVKHFGGVAALDGVSLSVTQGEIVGLIGPNGSGKSTLLNIISGFVHADSGSIVLDERRMLLHGAAAVRRAGVSRTFQNLRLFEPLTAIENLKAALHLLFTSGRGKSVRWLGAAVGMPAMNRIAAEASDIARASLESVGLGHRAAVRVSDLSYGEKKRLEIARALLLEPSYTLLDEPTAGLSPDEANELISLVARAGLADKQLGVLLVEHRLDLVLRVCDRIVVMDNGTVLAHGSPTEIAANQAVQEVYIGT